MTPDQEKKLLAMGEALAVVSPWQPVCVREALLSCGRTVGIWRVRDVTLRIWLQLDAIHSPVLDGSWSLYAERRVWEILIALRILAGHEITLGEFIEAVGPDQIDEIKEGIVSHVAEAFATHLDLTHPSASAGSGNAGWGLILPLYYRLRCMGACRNEALDTPLAEAFALNAFARWNDGWNIDGLGYAQRERMEAR